MNWTHQVDKERVVLRELDNSSYARLEARLTRLERRMDARFAAVEARIDIRFAEAEAKSMRRLNDLLQWSLLAVVWIVALAGLLS